MDPNPINSEAFFFKLAGFKIFGIIVKAVKKFLKIQNQKIQPTSKNDQRIENAISGFFLKNYEILLKSIEWNKIIPWN